jgi:putative polyketide hydroxylase
MHTDVIVVGGGPCGLMTAMLLGRLGIDTVLLEKHPNILEHPKAMGVTRRTGELFLQAKLLDAMLEGDTIKHPDAVSQWLKDGLDKEILGQAPFMQSAEHFTPCPPFHCPQPHVERVLRQSLAELPSVRCLFGSAIKGLTQTTDAVTALTDQGQIKAHFLVGADGDRSFVRESLGIVRQGPGEQGRFLSVYFRADFGSALKGRQAFISNVLGADFFEAFVAVNGSDLWLMHHFLDDHEKAEDYSPEAFEAIIKRTCGMPQTQVSVISINPWVMAPAVATKWRSGRVFLVGDAAARVAPSGGLGMNNGLQSAHNLAWKLAEVIRGRKPHTWLDSYQDERLPAAKFTFENSQSNAGEIFEIVTAALEGNWIQAKSLIQRSRRAGAGFGQDFGLVYESTAVLPDETLPTPVADPVNDYVPQGRPGHRAPHFEIQAHDSKTSILTKLGYEYTALLGEQAADTLFAKICPDAVLLKEGQAFKAMDQTWLSTYGISPNGGVLIRPDGYIAARIV